MTQIPQTTIHLQAEGVLILPQASLKTESRNENWYEVSAATSSKPAEVIIFDSIGGWGISARQLLSEVRDAGLFSAPAVDIRIHSPGGSVLDGFAIYNTLARLTGAVNIYIDGMAASMASVIAMLPNATVHIPENAWIMIHNPWGGMMGDANEMREYADFLDGHTKNILSAYAQKTGLDDAELRTMMDAETWMTGSEAVEKGFADVLLPEMAIAASINNNVMKEFSKMPEAAKNWFAPHAQTTQQPTQSPPQPQQPQQPAATVDIGDVAARAMQMMQEKDAQRRVAVANVFEKFPAFQTLKAECENDMLCTDVVARERLMDAMGAQCQPLGGWTPYADNGNVVGDCVKNIIMARSGKGVREKDNPYSGMTLAELARVSLTDRGVGVAGQGRYEIVGMAFTHDSSDFPYILMDVATKSALAGWDESTETFDQWTRSGTLPDFKAAHRVGIDSFPTLREVRPGAEYKYVTVGDRGAKIILATYGELFSINRQAIINDDLSFITTVPSGMGSAAKATIGDLVYDVLISNPEFDGLPLFDAERGNLINGVLSIKALSDARSQMKRQKSETGRHLNISPEFLLVPTVQETLADQLLHSISIPGAEYNANIKNPVQNMATIIADPRLDDADENAWYLTAAKGRDTIEVAYLDGNAAPVVESTDGFTVDGVTMKVRIDAGVAPMDYRGLLKSTGTVAAKSSK
ncbi:Clp protease ClpP [Buttiauxella sp. 3AFRM03]|uniref:ClpP-like prohead protease/major capsid protein fusion protein n=1 Tax=Buttiauxella sp. 3AFRM03 TaxID=2479367 RepID=UPI000EF7C8EF|nr:ClpP-like prohead protease/major capsid protein fusion protein [Buttiauxella sp. 3AFRM03]AYN29999.1 Clp protease ClpP [Buttiauxella sp. 3AFRM03]